MIRSKKGDKTVLITIISIIILILVIFVIAFIIVAIYGGFATPREKAIASFQRFTAGVDDAMAGWGKAPICEEIEVHLNPEYMISSSGGTLYLSEINKDGNLEEISKLDLHTKGICCPDGLKPDCDSTCPSALLLGGVYAESKWEGTRRGGVYCVCGGADWNWGNPGTWFGSASEYTVVFRKSFLGATCAALVRM